MSIVINSPVVSYFDDTVKLKCNIFIDKEYDFSFLFNGVKDLNITVEPFLVMLLPIAMKLNMDIDVNGVVSDRLLIGINQTQRILQGIYFNNIVNINVKSIKKYQSCINNDFKQGLFFSFGLDSWYSFCMNSIDTLIFVSSIKPNRSKSAMDKFFLDKLNMLFKIRNISYIFVRNNIRDKLLRLFGDWELLHRFYYNGIALFFSKVFDLIYISSGYKYRTATIEKNIWSMFHSLLLNKEIDIISDGGEAGRIEKIDKISSDDIAVKYLKVCQKAKHWEFFNCCSCNKCIRTMLAIELLNKQCVFKDSFKKCLTDENIEGYTDFGLYKNELKEYAQKTNMRIYNLLCD